MSPGVAGRKEYAPPTPCDGRCGGRGRDEHRPERWFKSGFEKRPLYGLKAGDLIRLRFVAEDCTEGAHGGAGFVDDVQIVDGCDAEGPTNSPIPTPVLPNVFTPNDDGINDVWGLNGLAGACLVDLKVYDRWGDLVFTRTAHSYDGTWDPFTGLWDGMIRTRRRLKGIGKRKRYYWRKIRQKDMDSGTVYYVLSLRNCYETKDYPGYIAVIV